MWLVTRAMLPTASATSWLVRVMRSEKSPWRWASAAESVVSLVVRVDPTAMERPSCLEWPRISLILTAKWL